MANNDTSGLGTGSNSYDPGWEWKNSYTQGLGKDGTEFGLERFGLLSATPDSTALFAGPPRFQGAATEASLTPIGLTQSVSFGQNAQLAQLYEIGSNRSFFTRGKTACSLGLQKLIADTPSLMNVLSQQARAKMTEAGIYVYGGDNSNEGNISSPAASRSTNGNIWLSLDSELTNVPFGLMVLFKSRGNGDGDAINGRVLCAVYLEYVMFSSLDLAWGATQPTMVESLSCAFDRVIPVDL